jgi:hypothetical protein
MAEKMPERFKYNEQTIETLTTWTAWTFSIPNRSAIIFFNGKEIQTTQDSIDILASLLPEPRRILLERYRIDEHPYYLMVRFYDELYQEISMALYTGTQDKLSALVEGFCAEVERGLK